METETMRCYVGRRERRMMPAGGGTHRVQTIVAAVYVEERKEFYPLKHFVRHSPTGFEWGYGGSGPADLARCILIHATGGDVEEADRLYQEFKRDTIEGLPREGFRLREDFVRVWIQQKRAEGSGDRGDDEGPAASTR